MLRRVEADYLRQRARSSRMAAVKARDVAARSAHARLALAYDDRAAAVELVGERELMQPRSIK